MGLARIICEKPQEIVVDEFTSVVDRQIARIGSQAFQKAWRRGNPGGKVVLLTPHYDILDWIQPDWVIDTKTKTFERKAPVTSLKSPFGAMQSITGWSDAQPWV